MLNEKNFAAALDAMNFTAQGNVYTKIFADNVIMRADLHSKKLFYPAQIKNHDRNNFFDESHRENLVVFECVNRLLDKGYNAEDIWLEKNWSLGHSQKSGRADICVSQNGKTLFIIECKTAGAEFDKEMSNMLADGGQLFSYWQQEQSCQWLMLYAADFDSDLKISAVSVSCSENLYRDAHTVEERFKVWAERYEKKIFGDVIFSKETVAYKIGVKPLLKCDLKNFSENKSVVNKFEEILRHNQVSDKENAFNRLIALFIAKLVDESHKQDKDEVDFQFREGTDSHETFQDRLQRLYSDGMKKFMGEDIFYLSDKYPDDLFKNFRDEENHDKVIGDLRENFRKLKFYTNNAFAFIEVQNDKLFYLNAKILREVVELLKDYKIIGSTDLQTLGDLFEQLLNKGFKQNEGQFFTPIDIAQFIWDSLPLDKIISDEPPKIIDYACGAGHFLTEGFKAVSDFYARKNLQLPPTWERDKLFGVEKDYRLARVSKISLFMHGANEGKIKFGDGLENYPDEKISPATFDILVANPPYSVKGFKSHLKLANELEVLDKISNDGSEIETLFAERIGQLVKSRGVAAVILPSSILNKDGKSFIAARESLLKNFFIRAIVQLGSKTFGATGTNTVIMFLERFDEPPRRLADYEDVAATILDKKPLGRKFSKEIFDGYLKKTGKTLETLTEDDRERIIYFGLTFKQMTLIISAPDDNKAQEKFLGYGWSNAKGREGIVHKKRGGLLFDNDNHDAENTLAAVIRAAFTDEQIKIAALEEYYHYSTLADMLDFDSDKFTKTITISKLPKEKLTSERLFPTEKLEDIVEINSSTLDPTKTPEKIFHYVDIGSIDASTNKIDFTTVINGATAPSRARRLANDGEVLISTVRPYLKSFALIKDSPQDTLYSTGFAVLSTKNPAVIINEFIFQLFMNDALLMEQMKAKMSKGSYPSINQSDLKGFHILLPPVDVQRQIVAEFHSIAAQTAQAEENIQSLDAAIKNKFAELFVGKNFQRERLGDIAPYVTERISIDNIQISDFITTDNMLKDKHGIKIYEGEPQISALTKFLAGDVLISNIRPYLKKIWLADRAGGCSPDVLVLRSRDENILKAEYLFEVLKQDDFFTFAMATAKGMKMPRGDKDIIKKYEFELPPLELQEEFAAYVTNCEALKKSARTRLEELKSEREELVTKYFR